MSHTNDLITGVATDLAAAGLGVYRSDGSAFLATETGIGIGQLPETTDRAIAINDYGTTGDELTQPLTTIAVQILCRGARFDKRDLNALRDPIYLLVQGMTHKTYGTCHVIQAYRFSSVPLGIDDAGRFLQADNYYFECNTPASAYRS